MQVWYDLRPPILYPYIKQLCLRNLKCDNCQKRSINIINLPKLMFFEEEFNSFFISNREYTCPLPMKATFQCHSLNIVNFKLMVTTDILVRKLNCIDLANSIWINKHIWTRQQFYTAPGGEVSSHVGADFWSSINELVGGSNMLVDRAGESSDTIVIPVQTSPFSATLTLFLALL